MAMLLCLLSLLAFLGGSNAESLEEGAGSRRQGRVLLQTSPQDPGTTPETGCGAGDCINLLTKPDCAWLTYPSGGPDEKSCKTAQPFTVALNNCFKDINSLAYVTVIAPAATGQCIEYYQPGRGTPSYTNDSTIAEVQLKCGQDVLIFAKGKAVAGGGSTVTGTRKNPPVGCRGSGGSTKLCDTCRFRQSLTCGANVVANNQVCRPARTGVCENDALCKNTNPLCPENPLKTDKTFVCRNATSTPKQGGCDVAETCDGLNKECPVNKFDKGSVCKTNTTRCNRDAICDGSSATCPGNPIIPASDAQVCRESEGECDPAETCLGMTDTCPDDQKAEKKTPCGADRKLRGTCDAPDMCDGETAVCPDVLQSAGHVCNPSTAICNQDAKCDGSTPTCPENPFVPASDKKICRESKGACDAPEYCPGTSAECTPTDVCIDGTTPIPAGDPYAAPQQKAAANKVMG